jgi:hypothetical protein
MKVHAGFATSEPEQQNILPRAGFKLPSFYSPFHNRDSVNI